MPVVIVEMYEGRTLEQKRALVRAITDGLHVIIHEVARENWARAGLLGVDREISPPGTQH
jgi:4-oxalocrotonate tautomerase